MNKRKSLGYQMRYVCMMLACLLMVGCQEEEKWGAGATSGFRISLQDAAVGVETKSTPEELGEPLKTNFSITVVKQSTGESETYKYEDNLVIPASAGTYDIIASYGDNPVLASDVPYYEGTAEDQKIEEDATEPVSVKIDCKVANALASVEFLTSDTEMKKKYDYYALRVKVENQSIDLTSTKKSSAYFRNGAAVSLFFAYTTKGGTGKEEQEFKDGKFTAEKGKHYIIKLKMEDDASMKIEKKEVEEVTINETIPMEWLPKPKIGGFNDDGATSLTYTETAEAIDAKLNFTASSAIQDIEFSFEFADTQEKFQALNNKTFSLQNMAAEDWALFNAAQITLPTLGESTKAGSFDFKTMTANLQTNAGAETVNKIKLRVKANDRWSSEEPVEYSIKTIAPKVTVTAKPEDIWSKELTVSGATVETGNKETILGNIKYQYNEDGEWKDCTGTEGLLAQLKEHPSDAKMRVRAVYRDVVACGETEIELEKPEQLPNSGFEDWYKDDIGSGINSHKNFWFPYLQGAEVPTWTTNNEETTNYRSESYCSISAVKRTTVKNSGNYAAWVRTVGHGIANTNADSFLGMNGSITGTGTIGILSYSDVWQVRPTQISFNYRYIQKGDDAGVVEVKIENRDQNVVLFETSFTVQNTNYVKRDIPITYSVTNVCATHLTLTFKSGSKHTEVVKAKVRGTNVDGTTADEHYGSEFFVDDISLTYDK